MTIGWILVAVITLILVTGTAVVVLDFLPDGQDDDISPARPPMAGLSWLTEPYGDRGACWGCGLEPEAATLCRWCTELVLVTAMSRG